MPAAELAVLWSLKLKVTSHTLCAGSALWCRSLFASQASSAVTLIHANLLFFPPSSCHHKQPLRTRCQQTTNSSKCPGHFQTRGSFVCLFVCIVSDELWSNPPWKIHLHIKLLRSSAAHQILMIRHGPLNLITMLKVSTGRPAAVKRSASVSAELILHNWVYNAGQFKEGQPATCNLTGCRDHTTIFCCQTKFALCKRAKQLWEIF